jgi:hypothetical protein
LLAAAAAALLALPARASHSVTTTVTPNLCNAQCNATATAVVSGGSGAFAYTWSTTPVQTGATATGLCAGAYLVVVSDLVNGDDVPALATVTDPPPIVIFFGNAAASCNGSCDGSSSASVAGGTGAYTYLWSNGGTGTSISGACAGSYSLAVADANACTTSGSTSITQPPALAASASVASSRSPTSCDGSVALSVTGGTTPDSVQWTLNGLPFTTQTATCSTSTSCQTTLTGLCDGGYAAHTVDTHGCSIDQAASVVSALTANPDNASTPLNTPVSIDVVANDTDTYGGGVAIDPATVDLDTATAGIQGSVTVPGVGAFAANASGVVTFTPVTNFAGVATRSYTVNDNGGFTSNAATISVTVAAPVITPSPPTLPAATVGIAYSQSLAASGGTAPYTFTVTAGTLPAGLALASGGTIFGTTTAVAASTFTVTATDANGFTGTRAYTLASGPLTTFTGPSPTGTGSITVTLAGGGAGCTFAAVPRFIAVTGDPRSPPAGTAPPGVIFPHGLLDFSTSGCIAGSAITLTVTYPAAFPIGIQYWKYGPRPGPLAAAWYLLPSTIGPNTATFTITDGQAGDDDLLANGAVVDQGGPGVPPGGAASNAVPAISDAGLAALATLLAIAGMLGARRSRSSPPRR